MSIHDRIKQQIDAKNAEKARVAAEALKKQYLYDAELKATEEFSQGKFVRALQTINAAQDKVNNNLKDLPEFDTKVLNDIKSVFVTLSMSIKGVFDIEKKATVDQKDTFFTAIGCTVLEDIITQEAPNGNCNGLSTKIGSETFCCPDDVLISGEISSFLSDNPL